jgi:transposase
MTMLKTYIVRLSQEERQALKELVSIGKGAAYKIKHANILLNIDVNGQGWTDEEAATAFSCHRNTVANLRKRLVNEGMESALNRKPRKTPPRQSIVDGEVEAKLIALRCGEPPAGQARWTLRLLADKAVELEIVPAISYDPHSVRTRRTKKIRKATMTKDNTDKSWPQKTVKASLALASD